MYYRELNDSDIIGYAYVVESTEEASLMGPAATDGEYYNNYFFMPNLIGYEDEQAMQALIVNYINQLRAQRGLKALLYDNRIDNYSHVRATNAGRNSYEKTL